MVVALGVLLVLAAGQGIWITTNLGEDDSPPSRASSVIVTRPACRVLITGAELVVAEARRGVDELTGLVGAYEQWREGRITDSRMAALTDAGRRAGSQEVRGYVDAQTQYANVETGACAGQSEVCTTRVEALKTSLMAGRAAMDLLEQHLTDLADFAGAETVSGAARAVWDRTRAESVPVLSRWREAEQALAQAPGCSP